MTLKKAISIFCIVIFNLTNALAYSETIVSEPVSLIHRYLINYLFSFIWKNIFLFDFSGQNYISSKISNDTNSLHFISLEAKRANLQKNHGTGIK